jgi:hypothetical protein
MRRENFLGASSQLIRGLALTIYFLPGKFANPENIHLTKFIIYAGEHPKATSKALQAVYDYCTNKGLFTADAMGKCIGNAAMQIGLIVIPGADEANEIKLIAKGAELGEAATEAGELAEVGEYVNLIDLIPNCGGALRKRSLYKRGMFGCLNLKGR